VGGNVFGLFIYLCSVQSRSLNRSNIYIDFFLLFLFFGWAGLAAAMLWCVVVKERWPISNCRCGPGPHHYHGRRQQSNFGLTLSARSSAYTTRKRNEANTDEEGKENEMTNGYKTLESYRGSWE
jgi:hypothetical protein